MLLITKQLKKQIPVLGKQDGLGKDAICYAHYFCGDWDWYVLEYDGNNEFFGIIVGEEIEYGYFYLSDFKEINNLAGYSKIERDIYWNICKIGEIDKLKNFLSSLSFISDKNL